MVMRPRTAVDMNVDYTDKSEVIFLMYRNHNDQIKCSWYHGIGFLNTSSDKTCYGIAMSVQCSLYSGERSVPLGALVCPKR